MANLQTRIHKGTGRVCARLLSLRCYTSLAQSSTPCWVHRDSLNRGASGFYPCGGWRGSPPAMYLGRARCRMCCCSINPPPPTPPCPPSARARHCTLTCSPRLSLSLSLSLSRSMIRPALCSSAADTDTLIGRYCGICEPLRFLLVTRLNTQDRHWKGTASCTLLQGSLQLCPGSWTLTLCPWIPAVLITAALTTSSQKTPLSFWHLRGEAPSWTEGSLRTSPDGMVRDLRLWPSGLCSRQG